MSHKYGIRYDVNVEYRSEGYDKSEAGEKGLTDSLLLLSILNHPDGSYSQAFTLNLHGKEKRELTQKEIFKAWLMLGISLHDEGKLEGWQKEFVQMHTEVVRKMFNHASNCPLTNGVE